MSLQIPDLKAEPSTDANASELNAILEGLGEGFYSVDDEWRITRFNKPASRYFGLTSDQVIGRGLWDLFPEAIPTTMGQQFFRAMAIRQPIAAEAESVLFENRTLSYRLFPVGHGLGVVWRNLASSETLATKIGESDPMLDVLIAGAIGIKETGRFVCANRSALEILKSGDALYLAQRVRATHKLDDDRLSAAIDEAARAARHSERFTKRIAVSRLSKGMPFIVQITSVCVGKSDLPSDYPAVLLLISNPSRRPRVDPLELANLFGFTVSEARVVSLLIGGQTLRSIAESLNVSFETARTHLARARAKTRSKSQIDLVRMLLTSVV